MKLEVCANSFLSAKNAQEAGAHRIELCQELSVGGITPSYGLLKKATENLTIETFVLIRPRSGNFQYSEAEFDIMRKDIELCKQLCCQGIVTGVLNMDYTIDIERTRELVELSKPMSFTFHRAFDIVPDPETALEQLIKLGVDRILSSGQAKKAVEGIELLERLKEKAKDNLIILPGGGVTSENARLFKEAGFQEIHASASSYITNNERIFNEPITFSDYQKIKDILEII